MADKALDLIIYGASGFTGRLVAEYVQQQYGNGETLRWAMAGRSQTKLEAVRDEIGLPSDTPILVADTTDMSSLQLMADQARCVLSTVGPYQLYGAGLVSVCANSGVDYVDLCGEAVWMRYMIDAHEADAKASGARIVFSCGFDSIPSDLGVMKLQQIAKAKYGAPCKTVECLVRGMKGTFSGGTAASLGAAIKAAKSDPAIYKLAIDPYSLVPDFDGVQQPDGDTIVYSDALKSWQAPFIMAAINTRNVHRSNYLNDFAYGKDFEYSEMLLTGDGERGEQLAKSVASDRSLSGKDAPKPGEGPSKSEREAGYYDVLYIGHVEGAAPIVVNVKGDKDPGYGSTSKMIAESALCLLEDARETSGGIWTTAPAMGDKLIDRLELNAGLSFSEGF